MKRYDDVVVGSGISGLTLALLLAMNKRKTLLLEKAPHIGGSLVRFYKKGVPLDTGFHFTGGFSSGGILTDMLQALGIRDRIKPIFLTAPEASRFVFEETGSVYEMPSGTDNFRKALHRYFPQEIPAIDTYFALVQKVFRSTVTLDLRKIGLSGWAAAIAASKDGAQTVLLEQNDFLGGTVIAGLHRYVCGLYGDTGVKTLNAGIARELTAALEKLSSANKKMQLGKVQVFAFRSNDLQKYLRDSLKKNRNLTVLLNSRAYAVHKEKKIIQTVKAMSNKKVYTFHPKVVIDASGDGVIIHLCKASHEGALSDKRQLSGFSFRVRGIKDASGLLPIKVPYHLPLATYTRLDSTSEGVIRLNIRVGKKSVTLKKEVQEAFDRLRTVLPEFSQARIVAFSPEVLDREGIRLRGEYTLTSADILRGRKFNDGVVKNAWPIELWDQETGPRYRYLPIGRYYEIPLRCLRSKHVKNLLACGRCISATHEALGSTRAAGTCISLGEQAGKAAAKL